MSFHTVHFKYKVLVNVEDILFLNTVNQKVNISRSRPITLVLKGKKNKNKTWQPSVMTYYISRVGGMKFKLVKMMFIINILV